jgi:hypothetical protein
MANTNKQTYPQQCRSSEKSVNAKPNKPKTTQNIQPQETEEPLAWFSLALSTTHVSDSVYIYVDYNHVKQQQKQKNHAKRKQKPSPQRHKPSPHLQRKRKSSLPSHTQANPKAMRKLAISLPERKAYCLLVASTTHNEMM